MKRMIVSIVLIILFVVAFSGCTRDDNGRNAPGITPLPTAVNPDITTDMTPDINTAIPGVSPMIPDGVTPGISPGHGIVKVSGTINPESLWFFGL